MTNTEPQAVTGAMTSERLRQALDDSVLTHTGRSIGDLASQRVIDDLWPLIEAREAALLAIARAVAQADNTDDSICFALCPLLDAWERYDVIHSGPCVVKQARALLADRLAAQAISQPTTNDPPESVTWQPSGD